jgi:hypothetical protein
MTETREALSQKPVTELAAKKNPLATQKAKIAIAFAQYNEDGSRKFSTLDSLISEVSPDALANLSDDALAAKTKRLRINAHAARGNYVRDLEILRAGGSFGPTIADAGIILNVIRTRNPGRYEGIDGIAKLIQLLETPLADELGYKKIS